MQSKAVSNLIKFLLFALCFVLLFVLYMQRRERKHYREAAELPYYGVECAQVEDGTYPGKTYTSFLHLQLEVTVINHQITKIDVIENVGSKGKNVLPIIDKMIEMNTAKVPAIKGEELASIVFISCVDDALRKGVILENAG